MPRIAYIALGSNLGDRRALIEAALDALAAHDGLEVSARSALIETPPQGGPAGQGAYLNAAARLETTLEPADLMAVLLSVERELGRERRERWGPRTIDLDLLLYDDLVLDRPGLTIPHPRMHERSFVLGPLSELAPELNHPVLGRTIAGLRDQCRED